MALPAKNHSLAKFSRAFCFAALPAALASCNESFILWLTLATGAKTTGRPTEQPKPPEPNQTEPYQSEHYLCRP